MSNQVHIVSNVGVRDRINYLFLPSPCAAYRKKVGKAIVISSALDKVSVVLITS